jgi:hypothetical protein
MLVSEPDYRSFFDLGPGVVNDIAVRLAPGADPAAVQRAVEALAPEARVVTRADLLAAATSFLAWDRGLAAVLVLAMGVALVILALDKPSALSAEERGEMGTLRALGWSVPDVLMAKAWESLAVTTTAVLAGGLAAYAHVHLSHAALFVPVLQGWAALAPRLILTPSVDLPTLLALTVATTGLPVVGVLVACYRPATDDPDAVVRQ